MSSAWGVVGTSAAVAFDDDASAVFATYCNYLQHLAILLRELYGENPAGRVLEETLGLPAVVKVKRKRLAQADLGRLENHLRIAWLREGRIHTLSSQWDCQPELLPGTPTDAYYAVYHGAQAFKTANAAPLMRDHAKLLHSLGNDADTRRLFPPPWSVTCRGFPKDDCAEYRGLPQGLLPAVCQNFVRPTEETAWPSLCLLLRTTRERELTKAKDDWKRKEKKQRASGVRAAKLAEALAPTSLFDFFWRLRVRTDYRDVDAFLLGVASASQAELFLDSLMTVLNCTLVVFEALVIAEGQESMLQTGAAKFAGAVGPGFCATLKARPWFTGELRS
jgi:hypothetical protein